MEVNMADLVSVKKAASVLNVSPSHVRKMILRGKFPFYRVGNRIIRVDLDEIRRTSSEKIKQGTTKESDVRSLPQQNQPELT